jgi:hypothetical protein
MIFRPFPIQLLSQTVCSFCDKQTSFQPDNSENNTLAIGTLRSAVRRAEKLSAGGETAGTEPESNDRRRAADGSSTRLRFPLYAATNVREAQRNGCWSWHLALAFQADCANCRLETGRKSGFSLLG